VLLVFQLVKLERLVIKALPIFEKYFLLPKQLQIGLSMPKALRKLQKIEAGGGRGGTVTPIFNFFPTMVRILTCFVLKLCGRYVPGLESIQASILR